MVTIPLAHGKFALIDDEDADIAGRFKWFIHKRENNFYARAYVPQGGRKRILLHDLILGFPEKEIDHSNNNGLDCRRHNLREATHSQNGANRRGASINSKSGIRGVYWRERDTRWCAKIRANGKDFHLGYFPTAAEAAKAYNVASLKYHGEFGRRNAVD